MRTDRQRSLTDGIERLLDDLEVLLRKPVDAVATRSVLTLCTASVAAGFNSICGQHFY